MSNSALFPNFTAPEDSKKGEAMLRSSSHIFDTQTPAQVEDTIVVDKNHGTPWRHEIKYLNLPTQKRGLWYNDEHLYHVPKPNESQQFYPYPPTVLVPNPKLRAEERSIDLRTANTLRNKEKQLMMTSNQIDYFKDGLGTHAPLNSDDVIEKKANYEATGSINDSMVSCILFYLLLFHFLLMHLIRKIIIVYTKIFINIHSQFNKILE